MSGHPPDRTVVLAAYHYPPYDDEVGGVRPSKFAKYLPELGWRTVVVTARHLPVAALPTQTNGVHAVREWPHPLKAYERLRERRTRTRGLARGLPGVSTVTTSASHSLRAALKRHCLAFLDVPDAATGWLLPAVWRGWRAIRENGATHLITTAPPFTTHLVGLVLSQLTAVRWIADFRDHWEPDLKSVSRSTRVSQALEGTLARLVVRRADAVVSVTPTLTRRLRTLAPAAPTGKFTTLTNGFDPADFSNLCPPGHRTGPVMFSYLGSFYSGRSPIPFLEALRALLDARRLGADDVRVQFTGDVEVVDGRSLRAIVDGLGLAGTVSISPPVTRTRALELANASDVLLVFTAPIHFDARPVKLYEALASGALVLHVGPDGEAAQLLVELQRGVSVSGKTRSEMEEAILACVAAARRSDRSDSRPTWNDPRIAPFAFPRLTADLACLLDALPPGRPIGGRTR